MYKSLLSPFSYGGLAYKNRLVLAPMTRCTATDDHVPTENIQYFYEDRASAGLMVTEATCIAAEANAYPNTPGIYSAEQIDAWKKATDLVHAKNGIIFCQLWHAGMFSHSHFRNGKLPIAPSAVKPHKELVSRLRIPHEISEAMTLSDFKEVRNKFRQAALNAMQAGFNGIELHASNGYLLDSFLHHATNFRTDEYGGSPSNMCRFVLEILDEVAEAVGSEHRVAIRISPITPSAMEALENKPEDEAVFVHLIQELNKYKLAYVHLSSDNDFDEKGYLNVKPSTFIRSHYKGMLIGGGGYSLDLAEQAIANNEFDMVFFGRLLLSNPNLIDMIKADKIELKPFTGEMIAHPPRL